MRGSSSCCLGVAAMIWRLVRALLGFAFGVLVAFVWLVPGALAETIAATPATAAAGVWWASSYGGRYGSAYAACDAVDHLYGATSVATGTTANGSTKCMCSNGSLTWHCTDASAHLTCASGTATPTGDGSTGTCPSSGFTCPGGQNWTLTGSQCTRPDCQYGRASDGTCTACPAGKYMANGVGGNPYRVVDQPLTIDYRTYTGAGATVPATTCVSGCTVTLGSEYSGSGSGTSGNWFWIGSPSFTGATCSPTPGTTPVVQPNTPEADCAKAGKQWGTVNGTVVCVDAQTTSTKKTSVVAGPGGGTTATTQTQTCTGGSCNSTTTVTNVGGGSSGTATNGTSSSSSASSGSQTQGDGSSACRDDPYGPACLGAPAEGGGAGSASGGGAGAITPVSMPGSAACPADVSIGHGVVVPFVHACSFASMISPLVLAFAWLGAGIFVLGGLRNG